MINLNNVSIILGNKLLLEHVTLTFFAKQKIGLIGRNGSGKSTLLSLIMGKLEPTSGEVQYNKQNRIAHVAQETPALECTALDFVLQGDESFWRLKEKIQQAEETKAYELLGHLHDEYAAIDGYSAENRASVLLHYLGFNHQATQQSVKSFSGGWRMRLNLAKALFAPSDILLLDEPTNHLDLEAIIWLEKWLQNYVGTLILISHDREFLDKIVTHIAHLEQHTIKLYQGNYSQFEEQQALALELQQASYEKQQKQIAHMMRFVNRFQYKASKARQAQSRLKMIEKMEKVAAVNSSTPFHFEFFPPESCQNPVLDIKNVTIAYGEKTILNSIRFQVLLGDRIGILGTNGSGKSTFIKAIAGDLQPVTGDILFARNIKIGYFAQHQVDALDITLSPLEHMQKLAPTTTIQELRNYLGGFDFSGDSAMQSIEHLSGGEKARLALATLIWHRPNLLLLDEPTNHLDIEVRMALSLALQNFEGALIVISHDRYLLSSIVDQFYKIEHGQIHKYLDTLDDYAKALISAEKPPAEKSKNTSIPSVKPPSNPRKLADIEKKLEKLQVELLSLDEKLSAPGLYDKSQLELYTELCQKQKSLQDKVAVLEEEWLSFQ